MSFGGKNITLQESVGARQEELLHNPATNSALSEANIVPGIDLELMQPIVDAKAFAAVPEHGGSVQETLEQLKSNPNAPLPSCIKNLGFTSTKQLIERLEGRDDPTKREPTYRELKAAKKVEIQKQKTTVDTVTKKLEKPIKLTSNDIIKDKTIKPVPPLPQSEKKALDTLNVQAPEEEFLPVSTEPERIPAETTTIENVTSSPPETLPQVQVVEDDIRQQILVAETEPVRTAITAEEQVPLPHPADQISSVMPSPILEKPLLTSNETPTFKYTPEDYVGEETALLSYDTEHVETMAIEPALEQVFTQPLDQLDEAYPHISDLTNPVIDHELPEHSEFQLAEISSDEFDLEITLDTDIYPATFTDEAVEPTSLEHEPVETSGELQTYIASLAPSKAEAAEPVIHALAETLKLHEQTDKSEVKIVAAQIQEIEKLFVDLLEALGIQESDHNVKRLLRTIAPQLFTVNDSRQPNEISISLRNVLGTQEYKPATITSIISKLIDAVRQKIQHYPYLGKSALAGTFTGATF